MQNQKSIALNDGRHATTSLMRRTPEGRRFNHQTQFSHLESFFLSLIPQQDTEKWTIIATE